MDLNELGARIKKYRKLRHLTQENLSEKAEITPNYMSHIERGKTCPSLDTIEKIARALDVTVDILLKEDNEENMENTLRLELEAKIRQCDERELDLLNDLVSVILSKRK